LTGAARAAKLRRMPRHQETVAIRTRGRGLLDVTREVAAVVARSRVRTGMCVVFCRHTSCSLLIGENADPTVRTDLLAWLERLAPDGDPRYDHDAEGPDDMAAHLRSVLTRTSETIPVTGGILALGTWQALYLAEHRLAPHSRELVVHVAGD
jgi:secondary thiamine-phosphate synthase enzyme